MRTPISLPTKGLAGTHKSYSYRSETPGQVIAFTGDTGPNDALTELARGAEVLVSEANSIEERMRDLLRSGQWQIMTGDEQERIRLQTTRRRQGPQGILARGRPREAQGGHKRQTSLVSDRVGWPEIAHLADLRDAPKSLAISQLLQTSQSNGPQSHF